MQLGEQQLVQPLPNPRLLPRAQPPPRRHPTTKAELLRQMLPADPRVQHEQDPLQRKAIINGLRPGYRNRRFLTGSNGSIRSHSPSGTSHGFALIDTLRA